MEESKTRGASIGMETMSSEPPKGKSLGAIEELERQQRNLSRRVESLEKTVNFLTILCDYYAKANGIKIDRYPDGTTIITQ